VPTPSHWPEGNIAGGASREPPVDPAGSKNLCMRGISMRENREVPRSPAVGGPCGEGRGRNPVMDDRGKSDGPVVPAKPPNNAPGGAAEAVEGRGPAEGNAASETRSGRRAGPSAPSELDRVRRAARRDGNTPGPTTASPFVPKAGAQCVSSARWDLRGGPPVSLHGLASRMAQGRSLPRSKPRRAAFARNFRHPARSISQSPDYDRDSGSAPISR
jgi:hypothetical protein